MIDEVEEARRIAGLIRWTCDHDFLPVNGHSDDDECTHRSDGTDLTYCGEPESAHHG